MRHETASRTGTGGIRLHTQAWYPDGDSRAVVVLIHGLGEHSSRYGHLAEALVGHGNEVHALDHRGHGRSEGTRAQVRRFTDLIDDMHAFVTDVRAQSPGKPFFILGHSMGGLVSLRYVIEHAEGVDGLIVSATAASPPKNISKVTITVGRAVSRVLPNIGVAQLPLDKVSRDPDVVRAYFDDPLITKSKVRARMGAELLDAMTVVDAGLPSITIPVLVLHGDGDVIADPDSSRHVHARVGSADKTLRIYPELWHEIFNEPERAQVIADVVAWLDEHRAKVAAGV